jgi:hypothetical protein
LLMATCDRAACPGVTSPIPPAPWPPICRTKARAWG